MQCVKPMGLSEFTPETARTFRTISIACCFVAAIACILVAMGIDNPVMSIIGCVVLVAVLVVEVICSRKLVLKNEPHPNENYVPPTKEENIDEVYEPYEDEDLEEIEDEAREDEEEKPIRRSRTNKTNRQID